MNNKDNEILNISPNESPLLNSVTPESSHHKWVNEELQPYDKLYMVGQGGNHGHSFIFNGDANHQHATPIPSKHRLVIFADKAPDGWVIVDNSESTIIADGIITIEKL